ncbi:hypothetical protein DFH29DRAFT_946530 [Suillus ampliporus]|nr:hypothetical protein DFH29DRAFT_946530 [Suillus ampliporus]
MVRITGKEILRLGHEEISRLQHIIYKACQTRSFSHIAELKMFHKSESVDPPTHIPDDDRPDFLYDSFVRPYVGNAVDGFYEYLKTNNNKFRGGGFTTSHYAKFCSIVQSSGTGKSRLMTELRNKGTIVVYMNLRELSDTGFPKRDSVPASILTEDMDCSQAEYTARCCALFGAIFKTLHDDLLTALGSGSTKEAIETWNDQMCDMRSKFRTEFFEKVRSKYQESLNNIKLPASKENTDAKPAASTVGETSDTMMSLPDFKIKTPKLEGESSVVEAYKNMLTALPQIFTSDDDDPKLVIGFDEAHPLSKMSSKGFRPSHILCRTIKSYCRDKDESVWVVFASTTSQVADFSAPQVIYDSLRVAVAGELLYPPYTHLGWDQNADSLSDISANDVAKFHHIVGFGRPLWKSLVGKQLIMMLAAQKLCKSKEFDPTDMNQALAVLSQRFGLDICFGHPDAVSYLEKGVASHLRICFSTTEDRSWAFTGYPSEPLLSCVAAILLHKSPTCLVNALQVLKEKVDGGMVELGQSGELTSRLLLLLAKDMFVRKYLSKDGLPNIRDLHDIKRSPDAELMDCQKVSVIDFLQYLFGEDFWSTVEEAETAFKHAYINFSHWVPMTEFISPKVSRGTDVGSSSARCSAAEWTLRHWHRTSAVQCCHLQPLIDKMIPIYFDDSSLGSDVNRVSQMFVSDKAGKHSSKLDLGAITRTHGSIQCLSDLPYIALLLDLNVDPKVTVSFPEKKPKKAKTDRCLRIYASGVSDTTFPFLHDSSNVANILRGLVSQQKPSQTSFERLEALVKFGSTARLRHSRWEEQ